MKSLIAVYPSHDQAVSALQALKQSGYPTALLSMIGRAEVVNSHLIIRSKVEVEKAELGIGALLGTILGILTGVGFLAIPGLGILYGVGVFFGALTGLWAGIVTGGFAVILTTRYGIDGATADRYEQYIKDGHFIVLAQGGDEQLAGAQAILQGSIETIELNRH